MSKAYIQYDRAGECDGTSRTYDGECYEADECCGGASHNARDVFHILCAYQSLLKG